jgi:trans-aconitate 2-methyltransferase
MPGQTTKDFGAIRDDYAFFEAQSTEAAGDLDGYARHFADLPAAGPLRMLDFGCGPGGFTGKFLARLGVAPERLRLSLVEPADVYRQTATAALAPFTQHPIEAWPALPDDRADCFDLVVSNHALYYVPDLEGALKQIVRALARPGLFLTAIAGLDNPLVQVWVRSFALLGKPVPYHTAEDVESALNRLGVPFEKQRVGYDLAFDDSEENRLKILRFLLAEHLAELPPQAALDQLAPYSTGGRIVIATGNEQFAIRKTV